MRAYSLDLRERILADIDTESPTKKVAEKFSVSRSFVRRLAQRRRESGRVAPKAQRHGPKPTWEAHAERVRQAVRDHPDATLAEYRDAHGVPLKRSTLCRALAALGLTRKKSRSGRPSRTGPT